MTRKALIIKSTMDAAEVLYPEETQQQKECLELLRQTVETFVVANHPDRSYLQSYGTLLSCLINMAVSLAMRLDMDKEDLLKMVTMTIEGYYDNAEH